MNNPRIIVIGSTNTDMVIKAAHLPRPGETILGGHFFMNAGGKGANQAVAAARLGGQVSFIAKTGNDVFGKQAIASFKAEGIDVSFVLEDAVHPSGVALITVDDKGENCIVVAPGANAALMPNDLGSATTNILSASVVLMQLETPVETIAFAAATAQKGSAKIILNPAPAQPLSDELLSKINIITPNQQEAELLTGVSVVDEKSALASARILQRKGIDTVIITLGEKGAFVLNGDHAFLVSGYKVEAADTTAAGDVFNGALAVAIAEGKRLDEAVQFACAAAAISVTRLGAQASAPDRREVETFRTSLAVS